LHEKFCLQARDKKQKTKKPSPAKPEGKRAGELSVA